MFKYLCLSSNESKRSKINSHSPGQNTSKQDDQRQKTTRPARTHTARDMPVIEASEHFLIGHYVQATQDENRCVDPGSDTFPGNLFYHFVLALPACSSSVQMFGQRGFRDQLSNEIDAQRTRTRTRLLGCFSCSFLNFKHVLIHFKQLLYCYYISVLHCTT